MVLKVSVFHPKQKDTSSTDLAKFLYPDESKRIQFSFLCSPQILVSPTHQSDGTIRVNRFKKIPIKKDGSFTYGAWPQVKVSSIQSKKLSQMLKNKKIRQSGHYYDLSNQACQEYELGHKRFVLIPDTDAWFEVKPIEWIYDFKTKKVHSRQTLWSCDEVSPKQLASFGWQALQANKIMTLFQNNQTQNTSQILRDAESDVLHAIRFLRDKEKEAGIVAGKGQKIFQMIRQTFYCGRSKQK